ncbi:RNA polymerase sigma-70 factor, ECF subfamily [Pontibacter indicus]|uniref:RNA polymerase sigma-70 factor, ECF subfamily n=2 Tax=Pontibacter indicus TaxID=1317125 RepID=A0A1R3WLN0_9BACT|nr:RNA polymerase sigma-70 factor, ECF subfamily [Pontibacter indicus]
MSQLYDRYSPTLYGIVFRIVKDENVAEDVLQEAILRIWVSFDKYDASKGRLFTWMLNICRNLAIDTIRSKQYRVSILSQKIEADSRIFHYTDTFKPEHIGMREIVDKLNPEQKQIIDLMYFDGLTQSEIAESYDIPLGTVKTRARNAVKFLSRLFKGRA